jgi:hypothetical protein
MNTETPYSTTHDVWDKAQGKYRRYRITGTVRFDFDLETIQNRLAGNALRNASGKSYFMDGKLKATVVGPTQREEIER